MINPMPGFNLQSSQAMNIKILRLDETVASNIRILSLATEKYIINAQYLPEKDIYTLMTSAHLTNKITKIVCFPEQLNFHLEMLVLQDSLLPLKPIGTIL